jgi:hypothetical protein
MHRLILVACAVTAAFAQEHILSFGVKGGVPLTDAFSDRTATSVDVITHSFSSSKNFVVGPMVELHLPLGFSVEANALYRPLSLVTDSQVLPQQTAHFSTDINSWEFPILGKYRFLHTPVVKPYVGIGPTFRHVGSKGSFLSNSGFALSGGIDFKLLLLTVSPEIRYSRWAGDATVKAFVAPPSNLNQAEFLIGLSF